MVAYAIKDDLGNFIGIDNHSGGYPFLALRPDQIAWFYSLAAAQKYQSVCQYKQGQWDIVEIELVELPRGTIKERNGV